MNKTEENPHDNSSCKNCKRYKQVPRHADEVKRIQGRLNRAIGQLEGIGKMIDDNRYCGDILIQLSAVQSALRSVGYVILGEHLESCVTEKIKEGDTEIMDETLDLIKKIK